MERVFGNYLELEYVHAMRRSDVPPNIRIVEFFLEPGAFLDSDARPAELSERELHACDRGT